MLPEVCRCIKNPYKVKPVVSFTWINHLHPFEHHLLLFRIVSMAHDGEHREPEDRRQHSWRLHKIIIYGASHKTR